MENTKRLKLRFLMLYAFSFILLSIILVVLWKKTQLLKQPAANQNGQQIIVSEQTPNPGVEQARQEIEALKGQLQQRDQQLAILQQSKGGSGGNAQLAKDLADKNAIINSLQVQLQQKEAQLKSSPGNSGSGDGEWRQKYTGLKASYDKVAASEQALKAAYKTVADDNKRLLSELQSIKRG